MYLLCIDFAPKLNDFPNPKFLLARIQFTFFFFSTFFLNCSLFEFSTIVILYRSLILDKVELKEQIYQVIQKVKDDARVIVRPSGTEKIIRIMVESNNSTLIKSTISEFEKIFSKY